MPDILKVSGLEVPGRGDRLLLSVDALTLEAGTAATLEVAMTRYANAPTMSPPWDAEPAAKAAKL